MKKILLIDDEDLVIRSIQKLLGREGYEVFVCRSGEEAVEKIKNASVDLIVCDVRMPRMNGVQTIKAIRKILKDSQRPPVKEILISGFAEDNANREVDELKVADYIYKPFDLQDFINAVRKNLESKS